MLNDKVACETMLMFLKMFLAFFSSKSKKRDFSLFCVVAHVFLNIGCSYRFAICCRSDSPTKHRNRSVIQPNLIQSNPWTDPIHVQLCLETLMKTINKTNLSKYMVLNSFNT